MSIIDASTLPVGEYVGRVIVQEGRILFDNFVANRGVVSIAQQVETTRKRTQPTGDTLAEIIAGRRGQAAFRDQLLERYGQTCLVTGCSVVDVLEAAHVVPAAAGGGYDASNGLLLRSDIHALFDLDLLGINPDTLAVELHPRCE